MAKGPLNKMKDVFAEIMPSLDVLTLNKSNKIFGLEDIYPRQIVKELLKVEVHHSVIFENLVEGVAELDESGHIIFANRSFFLMFGKEEHHLIGYTINDILDLDKIPELKEAYNKVFSASYNLRENVILNHNNKTLHVSLYNIINNNKCTGIFLIIQDVTSLKTKIYEIGALFNITQAFLSNLPYDKVLEYIIYELRRLVKAINITLLLSCEGFFKGDIISTVDRKVNRNEKEKIDFWVNKIKERKEEGLITVDVTNKINKVSFENMPILWFPLIFHGKYLGTILGFKSVYDEFNDDNLKFFEAVGNQLAVYLANIEFFHKLSSKKESELKIRKEIETIVKQEYEDCVAQFHYIKWLARNKKNILSNLLDEMSNSLSILRSYGSILTAMKEEDKFKILKDIKNVFYNPLHRVIDIKEDISMLNNIGLEEDINFHIFSMGDLIKKIEEDIKVSCTVEREEILLIKKLGDFQKLAFLIKMLCMAFYNYGIMSPMWSVNELDGKVELSFIFNISEAIENNPSIMELEDALKVACKDDWFDIDKGVYFFYWHLKSFLKVMNGSVKVESNYPFNIKIQLT